MSIMSVTYHPTAYPEAEPFLCAFQHEQATQYSASASVLRTGCGRDPQTGDSVTIMEGVVKRVLFVDFTTSDRVYIQLES